MAGRESAGLLLFERGAAGLRVLLVHPGGPYFARKDAGAWTIPKGEPEPGEAPLDCALREFAEETGLAVAPRRLLDLGLVTQKGGKRVRAWAFEGAWPEGRAPASNTFEIEWPPRSGKRARFPEVDRAELFGLAEARERIRAAQAPLLARLEEGLAGDGTWLEREA